MCTCIVNNQTIFFTNKNNSYDKSKSFSNSKCFQKLIDSVIQKFERNNTWFKRYMIGSENV